MNQPKSPTPPVQAEPEFDWKLDPHNPDYDYDAYESQYIVKQLREWVRRKQAQNTAPNNADEKDKSK